MIAKIIWSIIIEFKEDGLEDDKVSSGTECCLNMIKKLAVPVRVALLKSTNIVVGDLGASVHCMKVVAQVP